MCQDCGCNEVIEPPRSLTIQTSLLEKNDRFAEQNRQQFHEHGILAINLLSSPGAGKTAILERMATAVPHRMAAIVGDLATDNDARRLQKAGLQAVQITTGQTCHLEAAMIHRSLAQLDLHKLEILLIENVGNLVCPAHYDLGEALRVVIFAVTEGEDKPLKYPSMFKTADVVLINKMDLAEVVGFDRRTAIANIQRIAPQAKCFEVSARSGVGLEEWYRYLENFYLIPA
jgi:hydrogenase nickel incorporation protein HypB